MLTFISEFVHSTEGRAKVTKFLQDEQTSAGGSGSASASKRKREDESDEEGGITPHKIAKVRNKERKELRGEGK